MYVPIFETWGDETFGICVLACLQCLIGMLHCCVLFGASREAILEDGPLSECQTL